MAVKEYNVDLDIKGRVLASIVPNSTGSIVTWNATTNVFGLRTNAQIISDLNLSSNFITTNTTQTGLTGNKTSSGIWTLGQVRKAGQNDTQILLAGGGHRPVSDFALAGSLSGYVPTSRTLTSGNGLSGGGNLTANRTFTLGTPSSIGLSTTNAVTTSSHTHALDAATITTINNGQTAFGWGNHAGLYVSTSGESTIGNGGRLTILNNDHSGWFNNTVGDTENYYTRRNFSINSANNQMSFFIHGGSNSRRAGIQVGHSGSFSNTGILELNPFGGTVRINGNTATHTGNLDVQATSLGFIKSADLSGYATESWVNSQGFSTQTLSSSTSNIISGSTVQRAALTGDVTASQNSNATTIANNAVTHAKYQNIATQRILGRGAAGTGNVQELTLGSNLSLSTGGVLSATNTNTTYSAGTGLSLSGTTFGQTITTSGSGTFVTGITQTTNGFQINLGTPPNTNTTYSAGTVALLTAGSNQTNRVWRADHLNQGIKALTYNPDNLTFGSGLNYNTTTGVLSAGQDSIFAYSPQGGLYTTNWSSTALGQHSVAIGYTSVVTASSSISIGKGVFTGGAMSQNIGFSSNVNKALSANVGSYNLNNGELGNTFGQGLINRGMGTTVIGKYNQYIDHQDNMDVDEKTAAIQFGVGKDELTRRNAVTIYNDRRMDYDTQRDDSTWNPNTIPDIKWIQENISGGGGGGGVGNYIYIDHTNVHDFGNSDVANGLLIPSSGLSGTPLIDPILSALAVFTNHDGLGEYSTPTVTTFFNPIAVHYKGDIAVRQGCMEIAAVDIRTELSGKDKLVMVYNQRNDLLYLAWMDSFDIMNINDNTGIYGILIGNAFNGDARTTYFNVNPQIL